MRGVVGAGAGDDAGTVADGIENRAQQRDLLLVGGRGRFTGGARQHQAVAAGVDQWVASRAAVAVSSVPSGLNGVTIAVSTVPNRALTSNPLVLTATKITRLASGLRSQRGGRHLSAVRQRSAISKSAKTCGATSTSWRRHAIASRRISTSACSLARIAMKCRQAR